MNKYLSFSKVNLFLLVNKKKKNSNLHKIKSLFFLNDSLYDEISINDDKENKVSYYVNNKKINIDNCIIKKTLLFFEREFNCTKKYNIKVFKNIPIGSGLGGASSNAAVIANHIIKENNLNRKKVIKKIYKIGSDIPFFIFGYKSAIVYNYGEKIKRINIEKPDFKIHLNEKINCSTKDVYNKFDELNFQNNTSLKKQINFLISKKYECLENDLEKPCFELYKKLYNIKGILEREYLVKLSGSGSAFILYKKEN